MTATRNKSRTCLAKAGRVTAELIYPVATSREINESCFFSMKQFCYRIQFKYFGSEMDFDSGFNKFR